MSTGLQLHTETMSDWQIIRDQAAVLVKSGFLPQSIKTPEQALAIILTGRELGIGTMTALNNINVIQGKPTVPPQLMLALINRTKEVEDINAESSEQGATVTIKRRGRSPYTAKFGPKEAAAMGLSGKDNYKKQPATMYQWRAVAACARLAFPDVILGLYTPDEMGANTDVETGEIVDAQPEPTPPALPPADEPAPQQSSKAAGHILAKIKTLGWDNAKVRAWMEEKFNYAIETDDLAAVFDSFGIAEQRKIFGALIEAGGK